MGCAAQSGISSNKVLFLGLDNAGKTTLVTKLQNDREEYVQPTLGVNMQKLVLEQLEIAIVDVGGQESARPAWECYFYGARLVVFVVDATDYLRFQEASAELQKLTQNPALKDVPVILVANKTDVPSSYSLTDVYQYVTGSFRSCIDIGLMAHVSDLRKMIVEALRGQTEVKQARKGKR